MLRWIFILVLFFSVVFTQSLDQLFNDGNNFYNKNSFNKAIENYNKMSKDILFKILKNDLNSDKIYKLNSISSYKLNELKEIAKSYNIVPRRLKKEIYDDILNIIINMKLFIFLAWASTALAFETIQGSLNQLESCQY